MAKERRRSYRLLLRELRKTLPVTASQLSEAQANREIRLARYFSGIRLKGYEELVHHLTELENIFLKNRRLRAVSFLVGRAKNDFETALEASLSGFHSVAHDAMRDVMEIEFLFRDFYFEPTHLEQWISCSDKERNDRFRPAVLRQRHAQRVAVKPQDMKEAIDYKGHSVFLHVSPYFNPFGGPGLRKSPVPFADDSGFWEIFEHGRRLLFAIHHLRHKLARHVKAPAGPWRGLKNFRAAWKQTQDMQSILQAIMAVVRDEQRDEPSNKSLQNGRDESRKARHPTM